MFRILPDDLSGPEIRALLEEHFAEMLANSPKDSCHFLDFGGLNADDVSFWSIWDGAELAGCGALKQISDSHGEIKSMRTHKAHLRKGVAARMMEYISTEAVQRGYKRLSLETGTGPTFEPAQALYRQHGFTPCPPFGDYQYDPFSIFMTKILPSRHDTLP